jgi:hypothetical protein
MPQAIWYKSQLFAVSTAIGAVGFLAVAPLAQAGPLAPLPLAPACDKYVFDGEFRIRGIPAAAEDADWEVSFTSTGTSAGTGPAVVTFDDGGQVFGHLIEGGISGRGIDFRILWNNNTAWSFWGSVEDGGVARGGEDLSGGAVAEMPAQWYSLRPLACATPAAPPPQQPAPPQKKMATVTGDVDVYNIAADDVPGEDGVVGMKIGMLRAGQQVELGGPCNPDDWCKVLSSDLPGGLGFVWGHLQI